MQRELASFDIYVIASELQSLIGGYIEKIIQLSRDEIVLRLKNSKTGKKESLYIRNSELLCRTNQRLSGLAKPPLFTIMLRKHILNGKIAAVHQHEFDRILQFTINKKDTTFFLIVELFKNGNIILVNQDGKILYPLLVQRWAQRTIKPHEPYQPPPSQHNPFTITKETFFDILRNSKRDVVRTLAVTCNFSGTYAEELCMRATIDKNMSVKHLTQESLDRLYSTFLSFTDLFKKQMFSPVHIKPHDNIIDILPFPFVTYQEQTCVSVQSFSQGLEVFITTKPPAKEQRKNDGQKKIEKLNRQLQQQTQMIEQFTSSVLQKQRIGDVIYLHLSECQAVLDDISHVLKQKDKTDEIERISQNPIVKKLDISSGRVVVVLPDSNHQDVEITLDIRKTAVENAQDEYNASKKHKEKIIGAQKAIRETTASLKHLKQKEVNAEKNTKQYPAIEKQYWFERYRWFLSSNGNIVVGGRDAKSNDVLVKKYLTEGSRYIHADVHGAPSCIVKNTDFKGDALPISDKTLEEACVFAASYSKAWKQFGEAQAYWVHPAQVSKTPQSGEFLPKGAFMIRGSRNYCRCSLEIAVGEVFLEDSKKIMAGPVSAVSTHSQKFVVVQPGVVKPSSLARSIAKHLHVSVDDVLRALPPGNVRIVKTIGFELPKDL